jgi:hypothetical protein
MNEEFETIWKGNMLWRHFSRGTEETHENPVRVTGVPADIRTENLQHTSLEHHRYANPLDVSQVR